MGVTHMEFLLLALLPFMLFALFFDRFIAFSDTDPKADTVAGVGRVPGHRALTRPAGPGAGRVPGGTGAGAVRRHEAAPAAAVPSAAGPAPDDALPAVMSAGATAAGYEITFDSGLKLLLAGASALPAGTLTVPAQGA